MNNNLYCSDCLTELKKVGPGCVDLIYMDQPFFTQKAQKSKTRDNTDEYQFDDTWEDIDEYKLFMKRRIEACSRESKTGGLRCSTRKRHRVSGAAAIRPGRVTRNSGTIANLRKSIRAWIAILPSGSVNIRTLKSRCNV